MPTFNTLIRVIFPFTLLSMFFLTLGFASCKKETATPPEVEIMEVDYLIEAVEVIQDPFEKVPLAANLSVQTSQPCTTEYTVIGEHPIMKTNQDFEESVQLNVLGLYADRENQVAIKVTNDEGLYQLDTVLIQTDSLPPILPTVEIEIIDASRKEPGFTFAMYEVTVGGAHSFPFIMDDAGEIRWYMDLDHVANLASPGEFLQNGNLIFGFSAYICEFSLMGEEVNRFTIGGYHQHHDIFEKEDGNLLVAVTKNGEPTYNDFIIELNPNSGEIIREIDLRESLNKNRTALTASASDWAHVNSIFHDAQTGYIIVSARTQGVFAISMDNQLQWILAGHKDWGVSGSGEDLNNYLLTAIDANDSAYDNDIQTGTVSTEDFGWTFGQHSVEVLPNGNIIAFDNGSKRNFSSSLKYSRGVEYVINAEAQTIHQVWEYGMERGADFYSQYEGDMDILPITNNRLMCSAKVGPSAQRYARIVEVMEASNEVVFEVKLPFPVISSGRGTGVYRAQRINL